MSIRASVDVKEFGKFMKELRNAKQLTLTELSEISDVSHPYLSQIENGKRGIPSPDILMKLSNPLGIPYNDLMKRAGYIEAPPDAPLRELMISLRKSKKWLLNNGEIDKVAKKNIEYYLESNKITSITVDNVFDKLEEFINLGNWDELIDSGEDIIYFDLFDLLERLSETKEKNNQNLDAIIAHSYPLTYNGHLVTDNDRKLIISFLDALYANRN